MRRRCAVEGVDDAGARQDKGRERDIECADGARWRAGQGAGARYRVRGREGVGILRTSILPVFSSPGFSGSRHDLVFGLRGGSKGNPNSRKTDD